MSDRETREEITEKLRAECPIQQIYVQRGEAVNCVYLGNTNTCATCTYWWLSIADDVTDILGRRVAAVRRERRKVREYRSALVMMTDEVACLTARLNEEVDRARFVLMPLKDRRAKNDGQSVQAERENLSGGGGRSGSGINGGSCKHGAGGGSEVGDHAGLAV